MNQNKKIKNIFIENDFSNDLKLYWVIDGIQKFHRIIPSGDKQELLTYLDQSWILFNSDNINLYSKCFLMDEEKFNVEDLNLKASLLSNCDSMSTKSPTTSSIDNEVLNTTNTKIIGYNQSNSICLFMNLKIIFSILKSRFKDCARINT